MSTGFALPTVITKRSKTLSTTGIVTNDVIYTCPANCFTDVYLSNLSHGQIGQTFNLTSINLVRAGGPVPSVLQVSGSQTINNASSNLTNLSMTNQSVNDANSNAIVGTETQEVSGASSTGVFKKGGSVVRLFPNDFLVMNYNNINAPTTQLAYTTVEVFGQG